MEQFYKVLNTLQKDDNLLKLKKFKQHRVTTRYEHSRQVAICSYKISQKLHLKINEEALARGAMLHDFFMYDTMSGEVSIYQHSFKHAETALSNAAMLYPLSSVEKNIIYSHMWPLNITHLPKSKEAVLVCMADKYCAIREFLGKVN